MGRRGRPYYSPAIPPRRSLVRGIMETSLILGGLEQSHLGDSDSGETPGAPLRFG